jgi:hypothetical protein
MVRTGAIIGRVLDALTGEPIRAFNLQFDFSPKRLPGETRTQP